MCLNSKGNKDYATEHNIETYIKPKIKPLIYQVLLNNIEVTTEVDRKYRYYKRN